ncbi:hypothetical protein EU538_12930 [Candidatus Thorarchaeota archaeon]|nr:MAG: hypothetical protein EU538_12930 [Candidatus Thorarchaeota archaeon]
MKENSNQILGIMRARFPSTQRAQENAKSMKDCPRLVLSGTTRNTYYGIFAVRNDMRRLYAYLEDNPSVLGADVVEFTFVERVLDEIQIPAHSEIRKEEIAPCGSDCSECSLRSEFDCRGCPATVHYRTQD